MPDNYRPSRLFACITLILALLPVSTIAGEYNRVLSIGDPMPSFTELPAVSGKMLSSESINESIVVLVALANHCPWVQGMDHQLTALAKQYADADVRVIGLSVNHRADDRLPAMKVHAKENGYTFEYIYDESQQLGRDLGATRTPEYFVFDADRKLAYMGRITNSPAMKRGDEIRFIDGEPEEFYVADAIDSLLSGKPVNLTETRAHGCSVKYVNPS